MILKCISFTVLYITLVFATIYIMREDYVKFSHHLKKDYITFALDHNRSVYHPWADSEKCGKINVSFLLPNSTHFVSLVSYPGSGNTWTRYLMEGLTGVFTGSMLGDHLGEHLRGTEEPYRLGTTFITKSHFLGNRIVYLTRNLSWPKAIWLIRSPFDSIKAYVTFLQVNDMKERLQNETEFGEALAVEEEKRRPSESWRDFNKEWAKEHRVEVYPLFYEELVLDTKKELIKLADFLNVKIDPKRLECLLEFPEGNYHRKPSASKIDFPYSLETVNTYVNHICEVDAVMADYGYRRLRLDLYVKVLKDKFYIPQEVLTVLETMCGRDLKD